MTANLATVFGEVYDFLLRLHDDQAPPEQARARFRPLRERPGGPAMDLIWEVDSYTHEAHYDVLLHLPGRGTVSLGFCPDRGVPWPLRHAHHARESDVVRVNGRTLQLQTVMAYLDSLWNDPRGLQDLVDRCLIQEAVEERAVTADDADLQQAMDAFRREHGLHTAEATHRWLGLRGWPPERLEESVSSRLVAQKLRDEITAGRVEGYFDEHRAELDTAHLARVRVADEAAARQMAEQVRCGALDFFEAARQRFLLGAEGVKDLFLVVRRRGLSAPQAQAIFAASPGEVVGPLASGQGYDVVRVLQHSPARLDEPTRALIKQILFDEWLAERRRQAKVEWFWGMPDRTP